MDNTYKTSSEASRLQVLKLLQADPRLSQRQLAERMGVSLGKANYCLRALIEKGLVKLGNFGRNPNKRQYAYVLTPAGNGGEDPYHPRLSEAQGSGVRGDPARDRDPEGRS